MGELSSPDGFAFEVGVLISDRFGAVIEEFEVRDALLALFAEKDTGAPVEGRLFAPQEVPVYA